MMDTIQIDGSYGEGGGQVLRTSLSLAMITGRPLEVTHIRAGRSKPGLQPQHLAAVRAAAMVCRAELHGASVGSSFLRFIPQCPPQPDAYALEIGTAGATTLVAQTVLLPLARREGPSSLRITGGTHVPHAPPADYLEHVYLPILAQCGLACRMTYARAGFFPRGGGELVLDITPAPTLATLDLTDRGKLRSLTAIVVTSELPEHVGERGAATVEKILRGMTCDLQVVRVNKPSLGPGACVFIAAHCENGYAGFSALGERGKPMERVAEDSCRDFRRWWDTGAVCDEHLADQLALPAALADGESRWTTPVVTEHLRTVLWVIRQFLPVETAFEEPENGPAMVTMRGVGNLMVNPLQ